MSSPFNLLVIGLFVLTAGVMVGKESVQIIREPAPVTRLEGISIADDEKEVLSWLK